MSSEAPVENRCSAAKIQQVGEIRTALFLGEARAAVEVGPSSRTVLGDAIDEEGTERAVAVVVAVGEDLGIRAGELEGGAGFDGEIDGGKFRVLNGNVPGARVCGAWFAALGWYARLAFAGWSRGWIPRV